MIKLLTDPWTTSGAAVLWLCMNFMAVGCALGILLCRTLG